VELPRFKRTIATQQANVLPLFECEFTQRVLANEYQEQLAQQYRARQEKWLHMVEIVNEYSAKTQEMWIIWPPEFPSINTPIIDNALGLRWTAPDQQMFFVKKRKRSK
jgi:3-methyladenine DNA glycosylase AlkD